MSLINFVMLRDWNGVRWTFVAYTCESEKGAKAMNINVYFRKFEGGDVIALWDEYNSDYRWISSYQHIGQHSEASRDLITDLEPATQEEYTPLLRELESIGYEVTVL